MKVFVDMKGVPTRVGDRAAIAEKGVFGIVSSITPTGVDILLDGVEYPERFMHEDVYRVIQRVDALETATELMRGLMETITAAMEAEESKEGNGEDERSLYYSYGKQWAFRRAKSFVWHTLRGIERLEMAQDF